MLARTRCDDVSIPATPNRTHLTGWGYKNLEVKKKSKMQMEYRSREHSEAGLVEFVGYPPGRVDTAGTGAGLFGVSVFCKLLYV